MCPLYRFKFVSFSCFSLKLTRNMQYPCGFCGKSTRGSSSTCFAPDIKGSKVQSQCPLGYSFLITPASQISKKKKCTNVPVLCQICESYGQRHIEWKYNMRQHFEECHPNWRAILVEKRYETFVSSITISLEEHEGLGVLERYCVSWPDHELPILQRTREGDSASPPSKRSKS